MAQRVESTLWARIEGRLKALKRSARGASLRAGLDKDFARNIKRNKSLSPGHDKLRQLAERGLDCTLEELLGNNNARSSAMLDPNQQRLLAIYGNIPEDCQSEFLVVADLLAQMLTRDSRPPRRRAGGSKKGAG